MQLPRAIQPYAGLAVVAGVGLLFVSWWLAGGARWAQQVITDAAPSGTTGADKLVAGTAGAIGEAFGLPTPRQIAENPLLCQQAETFFAASVNCGVPDLVRWIRGDFNVDPWSDVDEQQRLLSRYPAP